MNLPWRIALYVVLAIGAVFFTQRFFASLNRDIQRVAAKYDDGMTDPGDASLSTTGTNAAVLSADPAAAPPGATNSLATTNPVPDQAGPTASPTPTVSGQPVSRKGWYGTLALLAILSLGLMVGREVSQFIGQRVQREIYGEASEPEGDAEYDEAERIWANGDHLEAVRLLRDFLNRHPNKLHAAFRIAEIYEKDLGNHLAAALEYEEILKRRFDRERWGWAAIHLVNLYNRLGNTDKAEALLQRVANDYSDTEAAAKARERLGLPEEAAAAEEPATTEAPPDEGGFKLPPGFRPK